MTKPWEETWHFGFGDEAELMSGGAFIGSFDSMHEDENITNDPKRKRTR